MSLSATNRPALNSNQVDSVMIFADFLFRSCSLSMSALGVAIPSNKKVNFDGLSLTTLATDPPPTP